MSDIKPLGTAFAPHGLYLSLVPQRICKTLDLTSPMMCNGLHLSLGKPWLIL
jgi:hypothetical protein